MRVVCEAGISVRTKDTRVGSVRVGAPGGIKHRVGWGGVEARPRVEGGWLGIQRVEMLEAEGTRVWGMPS